MDLYDQLAGNLTRERWDDQEPDLELEEEEIEEEEIPDDFPDLEE